MADLELLRVGRHFRVTPSLKIVLGRDERENRRLTGFENGSRWRIEPHGFPGPAALVCGPRDAAAHAHALALIARYTRAPHAGLRVRWRENGGWRHGPLLGGEVLIQLTPPPILIPVPATGTLTIPMPAATSGQGFLLVTQGLRVDNVGPTTRTVLLNAQDLMLGI